MQSFNHQNRTTNSYSIAFQNILIAVKIASIHPATAPCEDFVQLGGPEKEKYDRRKLK